MIILIGNQKGGVGKSTVACNISGMLVKRGKDVVLVEADTQQSATEWVAIRKEEHPGAAKIHAVQKLGDVSDTLVNLNDHYEYVIVDSAGRDSTELASAMLVCHTIVIPFRPSNPDLTRLEHMDKMTKAIKRINQNMRVVSFINSAPTNTQGIDTEAARTTIAQYPGIDLLETTVHDRRIYRDAMSEGLTVEEMQDSSPSALLAKDEMISLLEEILDGEI